jgi:hypothetical protein
VSRRFAPGFRFLSLLLLPLALLAGTGCARRVEVTGTRTYQEVEKPPYITWQPTLVSIPGTAVAYPQECTTDELYQVGGRWYWFYKSHWFVAETLEDPWRATSDIPKEFLNIPKSHPRHRIVRHHPDYKP